VVYKQKYIRYFYRFQEVLMKQSHQCELRVNLVDMNCFKNMNFFFMEDFLYLFPYLQNDSFSRYRYVRVPKIVQSFSLEHQIIQILYRNFEFLLYIYRVFIVDSCKLSLLRYLFRECYSPPTIIKRLNFTYLPLNFYIQLIEYDHSFIMFIDKDILQMCVQEFHLRIIRCLKRDINYFFLFDIIISSNST